MADTSKRPVMEHRQTGRWLAKLAGEVGVECAATWRKMDVPMYDALTAVLGQPYRGWDHDADGVLWYLLRLYCMGDLVMLKVPAGGTPARDHERRRNQETMQHGLPEGIFACVDLDQHAAEFDGHVHLEAPYHFERMQVDLEERTARISLPVVGPWDDRVAPLEIGYTDPSRTFSHLRAYGAVARWPYRSDHLYLLVLEDRAAALGLEEIYRIDNRCNRKSGGGLVRRVCASLDLLRLEAETEHAVSHLPPDLADERRKEIETVVDTAVRAAQGLAPDGAGPMMVQAYNRRDQGPASRPDAPDGVEVSQGEGGWTRAVGWGVVAFAKPLDPEEDIPLP
ncbi:hypothetical protein ACFWJ4_27240 [Kitasatospora sp. NPDC127067]|uniref:hypothetical protein n=1 Tax=Kitasatospora sp. NPDC127067 TaxID=3347126 RepID=UPI00366A1E20